MSDGPYCTSRQLLLSSLLSSNWNSQDECNLFGIKLHAPFDNLRDALTLRMELMQSVHRSENGWWKTIAYQLAMLNMIEWNWLECGNKACSQLNPLGIVQATHNGQYAIGIAKIGVAVNSRIQIPWCNVASGHYHSFLKSILLLWTRLFSLGWKPHNVDGWGSARIFPEPAHTKTFQAMAFRYRAK